MKVYVQFFVKTGTFPSEMIEWVILGESEAGIGHRKDYPFLKGQH